MKNGVILLLARCQFCAHVCVIMCLLYGPVWPDSNKNGLIDYTESHLTNFEFTCIQYSGKHRPITKSLNVRKINNSSYSVRLSAIVITEAQLIRYKHVPYAKNTADLSVTIQETDMLAIKRALKEMLCA